jgi:hypothetical protein
MRGNLIDRLMLSESFPSMGSRSLDPPRLRTIMHSFSFILMIPKMQKRLNGSWIYKAPERITQCISKMKSPLGSITRTTREFPKSCYWLMQAGHSEMSSVECMA